MSDIRFKICGSSPPFDVCATDSTTNLLVDRCSPIPLSGVCVTLGELPFNKPLNVWITNCVYKSISVRDLLMPKSPLHNMFYVGSSRQLSDVFNVSCNNSNLPYLANSTQYFWLKTADCLNISKSQNFCINIVGDMPLLVCATTTNNSCFVIDSNSTSTSIHGKLCITSGQTSVIPYKALSSGNLNLNISNLYENDKQSFYVQNTYGIKTANLTNNLYGVVYATPKAITFYYPFVTSIPTGTTTTVVPTTFSTTVASTTVRPTTTQPPNNKIYGASLHHLNSCVNQLGSSSMYCLCICNPNMLSNQYKIRISTCNITNSYDNCQNVSNEIICNGISIYKNTNYGDGVYYNDYTTKTISISDQILLATNIYGSYCNCDSAYSLTNVIDITPFPNNSFVRYYMSGTTNYVTISPQPLPIFTSTISPNTDFGVFFSGYYNNGEYVTSKCYRLLPKNGISVNSKYAVTFCYEIIISSDNPGSFGCLVVYCNNTPLYSYCSVSGITNSIIPTISPIKYGDNVDVMLCAYAHSLNSFALICGQLLNVNNLCACDGNTYSVDVVNSIMTIGYGYTV